jgi:hypothetical protein
MRHSKRSKICLKNDPFCDKILNIVKTRFETPKESTESILESVAALVDVWCERRNLLLLSHILKGYPLSSGLTDDRANLLESLENVRAFGKNELTEEEIKTVNELIGSISRIVYRK